MTPFKKVLLGLGVLFIVALALYGATFLLVKPSNLTETQTVTLSGKIVCLPHKRTQGPQTAECALGLKSNDQKYYGLKQLPDPTIAANTEVVIRGTLQQPVNDDIYNVVGNITITSLKQ